MYNKEDYKKLRELAVKLSIESGLKQEYLEDEKINNIIEEIIQIYKKY